MTVDPATHRASMARSAAFGRSKPWIGPFIGRAWPDSVTVEYRRKDGSIAGAQAQVIDFDAPASTVALRPGAVVVTFALSATSAPEALGKAPGKRRGNAGKRRETPGNAPEAILSLLWADPRLSISELAARLHKSSSAVERAIRKLRESERLERISPAKGMISTGIPTPCRDRHDHIASAPESRHRSRHHVAIAPYKVKRS